MTFASTDATTLLAFGFWSSIKMGGHGARETKPAP